MAHAGAKWLSKRWGGATVLTVSHAGEKTAKELVARAVSGETHFVLLKQLLIRPELLEDATVTEDVELLSSDIDSHPEPSTGDSAKRSWTDEVLARAQKLTVLTACMDTAPLVNHLQHLKHLVLCCGDFHVAIAVLPQAVFLETFCLGTLRRQQLEVDWSCSLPIVDYRHEPLALPALLIGALPHLQSVALRDVRPQKLQLPAGCVMHLSGDSPAFSCWNVCLYVSPTCGFLVIHAVNHCLLKSCQQPYGCHSGQTEPLCPAAHHDRPLCWLDPLAGAATAHYYNKWQLSLLGDIDRQLHHTRQC